MEIISVKPPETTQMS